MFELNNIINFIIELILRIPIILISLVVHEYAHAYASYKLGDETAKSQGRLTLNPLKHLDVFGTLMLLFFKFGWAKPVPINPYYYKNRKLGTILVSLSGPLSNFILAFLSTIVFVLLAKTSPDLIKDNSYINSFVTDFMFINVSLFVFNLIPVPPLDGSKVLTSILPDKISYYIYKYEYIGMIVLIILVYQGSFNSILTKAIRLTLNGFLYIITQFIPL